MVVVRLLIAAATLVVLVGAGIVWAGGAHAAGRATPHQYRPVQVPVRTAWPARIEVPRAASCAGSGSSRAGAGHEHRIPRSHRRSAERRR